ncbi:unnamed protein product [Medioppia subpectinata]|uniref:Uncharacterized protein n=1 Tax=Medioppia subpectinata TaxID=1979941 RepID=A0A7R9Q2V2_9ACAR|nr:unnamed protein product [Medioppia subpectinata]CAG2110600.1 unnamed protein product [Medioppia subpectinata]
MYHLYYKYGVDTVEAMVAVTVAGMAVMAGVVMAEAMVDTEVVADMAVAMDTAVNQMIMD